ncbi:MAG: mechanosensitive ion channel family protein [Planctomycetes bacterium]|nr:mechanosensitive ion channel family protein [Planctomycetota bacterium]
MARFEPPAIHRSTSTGRLLAALALMLCVYSFAFAQEGADAPQPALVNAAREAMVVQALDGEWLAEVGSMHLALRFSRKGDWHLDGRVGTFTVRGNRLELTDGGARVGYTFALTDTALTLSGGDLAEPVKFTRKPEITGFITWLFGLTLDGAKRKAYRVGVILVVLLAGLALIRLGHTVSNAMIFSEWGPLKVVYKNNKRRAATIHALVLNVCKYLLYAVALGYILSELGINYMAYLASLSVIGLALGFGSQGLVQDMVTGFFLLLEGQFDVGDMVEISGQNGVVQELGLRTTKIANYLGQVVVLPNRAITSVSNYSKGALDAYIDVAVPDAQAAQQVQPLLEKLGEEIGRQFDGAILSPPHVLKILSLGTEETFVRLNLGVWPQQQWVVDQQLIPRIKECLARAQIAIPSDRVVAFYRVAERVTVPGLEAHLGALLARFRGLAKKSGIGPTQEDDLPGGST